MWWKTAANGLGTVEATPYLFNILHNSHTLLIAMRYFYTDFLYLVYFVVASYQRRGKDVVTYLNTA